MVDGDHSMLIKYFYLFMLILEMHGLVNSPVLKKQKKVLVLRSELK